MTTDRDVLRTAQAWRARGQRVALASVVSTWGSSPRPVGSQLAINEDGSFVGSVSGGCIEGAVVTEALEIIGGAAPKLMEFGVSNEMAWEVGLACGGAITVFVEPLTDTNKTNLLTALNAARQASRPAATVTRLTDARNALIVEGTQTGGDLTIDERLRADAEMALRRDKGARIETALGDLFINVFNPPLRMIIIGAVHIAQALAPMAEIAGFEVILIDPRGAWATEERFPGFVLDQGWPDEALESHAPNRRTAIVALTHDPKIDDPALAVACRSEAFYIGALGSKKSHAARLRRLRTDAGLTTTQLDRIHGPVGLDIGAVSPSEIAAAILAQVILTLRGPKSGARIA